MGSRFRDVATMEGKQRRTQDVCSRKRDPIHQQNLTHHNKLTPRGLSAITTLDIHFKVLV